MNMNDYYTKDCLAKSHDIAQRLGNIGYQHIASEILTLTASMTNKIKELEATIKTLKGEVS